jgi:serine/threonine protein kinase
MEQERKNKPMSRSIFIESLVGNIKEKYFFEKKLGSGGYGAVYLAKDKKSGKYLWAGV